MNDGDVLMMLPSVRELLRLLVRLPSVNPMGRTDIAPSLLYESRVVDLIAQQFETHGLDYDIIDLTPGRANIIATYHPENEHRHLLFEAHTDTVPVDGMIIDPFGAKIENGRLYGRGACDVKAGVAAMLHAFLRVCEAKPKSTKLTVAFTADEEHTFLGVQSLVKENLNFDFGIVAEPTKLNIVTSHKGVVRWTTRVAGKACHSSEPRSGVNAIYRMAKVLAAIERYAATRGESTISVGVIRGGAAPNTVPDECAIDIDRRLIPGESANAALDDFNAMITAQRFDFEVFNEITFACPPLEPIDESHPHLLHLREAIRDIHGPHSLDAVPFGTDAATLAEAGVPCVVFGPGDIAQAHTKDEWVDLAEVEKAAEILYRFAISTE